MYILVICICVCIHRRSTHNIADVQSRRQHTAMIGPSLLECRDLHMVLYHHSEVCMDLGGMRCGSTSRSILGLFVLWPIYG